MLKAVLVDMDGTLVHSVGANAAAYATALAEWGIVTDPDALAPDIDGRSWRDFLPALMANRPDVRPEAVARRKRALYPEYFHLLRLNQPLVDLLQMLRGQVAVALVTTASAAAVSDVMDWFSLRGLFDTIITGDDVQQPKPHPEAYMLAASRLGCRAGECMVIEDSETGMAAARAFGGSLLRWTPVAQPSGPNSRAQPACAVP